MLFRVKLKDDEVIVKGAVIDAFRKKIKLLESILGKNSIDTGNTI